MGSLTKQTISAQIPTDLANAVENLAVELDRSKKLDHQGSVDHYAG